MDYNGFHGSLYVPVQRRLTSHLFFQNVTDRAIAPLIVLSSIYSLSTSVPFPIQLRMTASRDHIVVQDIQFDDQEALVGIKVPPFHQFTECGGTDRYYSESQWFMDE